MLKMVKGSIIQDAYKLNEEYEVRKEGIIANINEDKISKVIDEKLEGMDEVVVELIRCKTDNETLRQKIIDLNKEIYQLKNDLNSYKPIGMGFYKKKEKHIWE